MLDMKNQLKNNSDHPKQQYMYHLSQFFNILKTAKRTRRLIDKMIDRQTCIWMDGWMEIWMDGDMDGWHGLRFDHLYNLF